MATPNRIELAEVTGVTVHDLGGFLTAGEALRQKLDVDFLAVTLGELGMAFLDKYGIHRLPSEAREVFDVSGAGDTVIATVAAARIAGLARRVALQLANIAAGIVVGRTGTVPIDRESLREAVAQLGGHEHRHKTCDVNVSARRRTSCLADRFGAGRSRTWQQESVV
jgi:D-beta-D-heptose 7-phosphate kinase/D-beta-D-heptose 1-phosphate adenosyltransferase